MQGRATNIQELAERVRRLGRGKKRCNWGVGRRWQVWELPASSPGRGTDTQTVEGTKRRVRQNTDSRCVRENVESGQDGWANGVKRNHFYVMYIDTEDTGHRTCHVSHSNADTARVVQNVWRCSYLA